jgi:hypothetical protein
LSSQTTRIEIDGRFDGVINFTPALTSQQQAGDELAAQQRPKFDDFDSITCAVTPAERSFGMNRIPKDSLHYG